MFSVSVIGPDGVGKTTIVSRLQRELPLPIKYVYMGDNIESCNYILPTTRWWKKRNPPSFNKDGNSAPQASSESSSDGQGNSSLGNSLLRSIKKAIGFVNRILDLWYRYFMVFYFKRRGYVVLLDRHFVFDYYHFDIAPEDGHQPPFRRRLHGMILKHTIPDPDLVICLDAPADVIFKRKREFSVDYIQSRRDQYKSFGAMVSNFEIVNANRDLDNVVASVSSLICNFNKN
jgi:thymidylate kinase